MAFKKLELVGMELKVQDTILLMIASILAERKTEQKELNLIGLKKISGLLEFIVQIH